MGRPVAFGVHQVGLDHLPSPGEGVVFSDSDRRQIRPEPTKSPRCDTTVPGPSMPAILDSAARWSAPLMPEGLSILFDQVEDEDLLGPRAAQA